MIEAYGELVRRYHDTLDLVSDRALQDWPALTGTAAVFGTVLSSLAPDVRTVLDIGSGAGLPAIPMAIGRPELEFHLVERRRRRVAFLRLAVAELGLRNVHIHGTDVRDVTGVEAGAITAQAVGTFRDLYCLSAHLHAAHVLLLSRKGPDWSDEVSELTDSTGAVPLASEAADTAGHSQVVGVLLAGGAACR